MSIIDYQSAVELMQQHTDLMDFVGPRPNETLLAAEKALGLKFPLVYRHFLLEYGAGGFGGEEIYGIINPEFENSGVPDAIWYTLESRGRIKLPHDYIVIYSVGNGEIFCSDLTASYDDKAPVVAFEPGLPIKLQNHEVIAQDFGEFLLQRVREEIDFLASQEI